MICVMMLLTISSYAQNPKIEIGDITKALSKAKETVNIDLEGPTLKMATQFLKSAKIDGLDDKAIQEIVSNLTGVYIRVAEFEKENQYSKDDFSSIRKQLEGGGWSKIIKVTGKEDVDIYLMYNGKLISGIGIIVCERTEFVIVNIVGSMDPAIIKKFGGKFGIPKNMKIDKLSR